MKEYVFSHHKPLALQGNSNLETNLKENLRSHKPFALQGDFSHRLALDSIVYNSNIKEPFHINCINNRLLFLIVT